MQGRNQLVRSAERRLSPELGPLLFVARSRKVHWKALPFCLAAGFIYGTIAEFVSPTTSDRTPGHFADIRSYLLVSLLTGLVLWSLTLFASFRKLLVFQGGLAARFSQKRTTLVFPWSRIDVASIRTVTTGGKASPARLLTAEKKPASLGISGENALVFRTGEGFWLFESGDDPAPLVLAIQQALIQTGAPDAIGLSSRALPPTLVTVRTRLD